MKCKQNYNGDCMLVSILGLSYPCHEYLCPRKKKYSCSDCRYASSCDHDESVTICAKFDKRKAKQA